MRFYLIIGFALITGLSGMKAASHATDAMQAAHTARHAQLSAITGD